MGAGRSMRRYAYAGILPQERQQHHSSVDVPLMVLIATLVIVTVAALSDPVISAFLARSLDKFWAGIVTLLR